jgi:hypothetical protein
MAFTVINTTDTLEQMRVKLNTLTQTDFGDPSTLAGAGLSATSICGAVVEIAGVAFSAAGWTIRDSSSSIQAIGAGQTLNVLGTSNQISAVVSATDTLTISLTPTVNITTALNVSTISISSGLITSSTGSISFSNENLVTTGTFQSGATTVTSLNSSGAVSGTTGTFSAAVSGTTGTFSGAVAGTTGTFSSTLQGTSLNLTSGGIVFEGATNDAFETTLTVTDPTADRTITIPNITGTIITSGDTGTVTSTMIANGTIVNDDIADTTIRAAKLNLSADTLTVNTLNATTITGSGGTASTITLTADNTTAASNFITFSAGATGSQSLKTDTDLTYNPNTNVLSTTASQANYADLAEIFKTDKVYDIGTVVMIGGSQEVTECFVGHRVLGVISDKPAFLMNAKAEGQPIALKGRVLIKVVGEIKKGDELVAGNGGFAAKVSDEFKKVFAIALEDNQKGLIEAVIL